MDVWIRVFILRVVFLRFHLCRSFLYSLPKSLPRLLAAAHPSKHSCSCSLLLQTLLLRRSYLRFPFNDSEGLKSIWELRSLLTLPPVATISPTFSLGLHIA